MAVSADLTQLALVAEATPGVTPAAPVFDVARITSESLAFNPTTQLSNELNPARQVTDVIVSGGSSGGAIGMELSRNKAFEAMLEGTFGNNWGATVPDRLEVGGLLKTYLLEKRFAIDPAAAPPVYDFHRINNAIMDSLTLTFAPGAADLGALTILGGHYTRGDAIVAGATYTEAGTRPVMVGADALPVMFNIGGIDYLTWCMTQVVINYKNNGRAIECLGTLGAAEMVLGRFEAEVTMDILVGGDTSIVMDTFLDQTEEVAFALEASDTIGNSYWFEFDRCRIKTCTQLTPGTNQDVVLAVALQALVATTHSPPDPSVESCATVTRAPTVPLDAPVVVPPEGGEEGALRGDGVGPIVPGSPDQAPAMLRAMRAKLTVLKSRGTRDEIRQSE